MPINWGETLAVLLLTPYYIEIAKGVAKRQLDLAIPPVITVFILIYLRQGSLALIFSAIILAGYLLKSFILWRVRRSISAISRKLPREAHVRRNGKETDMDIGDIKVGDILLVKSGDRLATDAVLVSPDGLVDESVVTGESRPVQKKAGDKLLAGSINLSDYFEARAVSTSQNSTLAQIEHMVNTAQNQKAPLAKIVTKYAWWTSILAVLGVAAVFILTRDIFLALSFWIAVVPVIFAIVVPLASTIGIVVLARRGILVKDSPALENISKAKVFLLDKTGTITKGTPAVTEVRGLKVSDNKILQIASGLDNFSNHPLASAIVGYAQNHGIKPLKFTKPVTLKGLGVKGFYRGKKYFLGSKTLLSKLKIDIPENFNKVISPEVAEGKTPVFVVQGTSILGAIFLADEMKENAPSVISGLAREGKQIVIVTGDKEEVAKKIASVLPPATYKAEVLPEEKVDVVDQFVREGKIVAMTGDGINDAPALAKAQVGIAMGGKGIDLTISAANIILLNDNLASIPYTVKVAKATFRIIKQDVALATTLHLFTAAFVMAGVVGLTGSALMHEVSSTLVLLNTLRIFVLGQKNA